LGTTPGTSYLLGLEAAGSGDSNAPSQVKSDIANELVRRIEQLGGQGGSVAKPDGKPATEAQVRRLKILCEEVPY